jgi:hypothetical protein
MRKLLILVALVATPAFAQSQVRVDGHVRKDGTYVPPHTRTAPNNTTLDNWSTKGNTNPTTGKQGTRNHYPSTDTKPRRTSCTYGSLC